MAERKYEKYIQTDLKLPQGAREWDEENRYDERATRILWLEDEILKGAFSVICSWYWKATETPTEQAHTHDFDEVIGFFGSDAQNPQDLCGEVEFWLEDEKYILTKSCLIFAPKGMKHCPLRVIRADRPIFFLAVGTEGRYSKMFDDKK